MQEWPHRCPFPWQTLQHAQSEAGGINNSLTTMSVKTPRRLLYHSKSASVEVQHSKSLDRTQNKITGCISFGLGLGLGLGFNICTGALQLTSQAKHSVWPIWDAACTGAMPSLARGRQLASTCCMKQRRQCRPIPYKSRRQRDDSL